MKLLAYHPARLLLAALLLGSAAHAGRLLASSPNRSRAPAHRPEALPAPRKHVSGVLHQPSEVVKKPSCGWSWMHRLPLFAPLAGTPQPTRCSPCCIAAIPPSPAPQDGPHIYDAELELIQGGDPIEQEVAATAAASCIRVGPARCAANRAFVQQLHQHCPKCLAPTGTSERVQGWASRHAQQMPQLRWLRLQPSCHAPARAPTVR